ncbi:outer membrane protein assembly factor BamB [Arenimonas terrae]|uniref:Outer membrane protein assembly factor BamB n=1 Tax=Arenimonas terrae TaxID=2546226 RepID=A0A5C4RVE3_9GAMM|nr:outer membrane protein assembly factor BamB [Arenimonas terrae]TNJ34637.1 outer membrane protein assembly factor BamB [Arenimonas terrae]
MSFRIVLLALILVFATGCSTIKGWFGDSKGKALEPAELTDIASPIAVDRAWSLNLGDGREKLGLRQKVAVEGERLYVSNDDGQVLAINAGTGDVIWDSQAVKTGKTGNRLLFWRRKTIEAGLSGGPGVGNGLVVVGGRNGEVIAFDAETGAERWKAASTSEVIATPLVAGGLVVVRSNDGRTFGFDAADGTRKWVFDRGLPNLSVRGNGTPVAGGELVYLGYDDGSVIALRLADGLLAWEQLVAEPDGRNDLERMADVDGELQLGLSELYATSFRGQTVAISTTNGEPMWNRDIGGYGGLALLADRVVLADPAGTVWALDRNTGSALWKQEALARRWLTSPAVQGNYIVVGDIEGYLHWIRADDGVIVGRDRIENSAILGTPQVSASGTLFAITAEGKLAAYPQPQ